MIAAAAGNRHASSLPMPPLTRILFAPALLFSSLGAAPAWERLPSLPIGNGGFVSGVMAGDILIAGGTTWQGDVKRWLDRIWTYDTQKGEWREVGTLPAPIAYGVAADDGQTWWFAGGTTGDRSLRTLWRVEPGAAPRRVAELDRGLVYAAGARIGNKLYAAGGSDDQGALDRIGNQFVSIDLESGHVRRLAAYPEAGLSTGTAAATAGRIHVFGGARWDPEAKTVVNHASAHAYSVTTGRWEKLPDLPYPGRGYCAVTLDEGRILVAGGYRNDEVEFVRDALIYDVNTRRYAPTVPLPYAGMVALVAAGDWVYCLGGEDRKRHRTDAAFRIRIADLLAAVPTKAAR